MLDLRAPLTFTVAAAAASGLVLGAAAWALAGGAGFAESSIADVANQFPSIRLRGPSVVVGGGNVTRAIGSPLFALIGAKGVVADPVIRLEGVARSPGRLAALLAIDAKPAAWLSLGETRDGVTLVEVLGSKVTVDTAIGVKEIRLGEATSGQAVASSLSLGQDSPPPGYRMPPPPASAPSAMASPQ